MSKQVLVQSRVLIESIAWDSNDKLDIISFLRRQVQLRTHYQKALVLYTVYTLWLLATKLIRLEGRAVLVEVMLNCLDEFAIA